VGDDDICLKSGKDEDGRRRAIPTENVVVTKCVVYKGHGGFVVGSEMSGGVKNVYVDNCVFMGTDVGIRFKSKRGRGGVVENIYVNNVKMINIETDPLLFDLFYGGKSASESLDDKSEKPSPVPVTVETPSFKNIYIKDVTCNGALRAMYFNGLPEMNVLNVNLENMTISSESGAVLSETDGVTMKNIVINAKKGTMLSMYNVKNATIDNVSSSKPENDIVKIDGGTSKDISIRNMNLKKENLQSNIKIKK
jgi:polygalacturonase